MTAEPFDPDDLMAALDRLRDIVFLAKDEAGRTGTISATMGQELALLGADCYVLSKRLWPRTGPPLPLLDGPTR